MFLTVNARLGLGQAMDNTYSRGTRSAKSNHFQTNPATTDGIFLFRPGKMLRTSRLGASAPSVRFLHSRVSKTDNLKITEGPGSRSFAPPNVFQ